MDDKAAGQTATLYLSSEQLGSDGGRQSYAYTVPAKLYSRGNSLLAVYQEPPGNELGRVETTVFIRPRSVTIIRRGDTSMKQTIAADVAYQGEYKTAYGVIPFSITTHSVNVNLLNRGFRQPPGEADVALDYTVLMLGEQTRIQLKMEIRTEKDGKREPE